MKGNVRLAIWRKRPQANAPRGVLVLVHGSSVGARATFDLTVPGKHDYSMMDWFALRGYDVWAMDHEGYGKSTTTAGNSDIQCGVDDLAALAPVIAAQTGAERVSMYGLSSGALRAALFADHPTFAGLDFVPGKVEFAPKFASKDKPAAGALKGRIADFYMTNPIARASVTMSELSAIKSGARLMAAE